MPTSLHGTAQLVLGMLLFSRGWKAASEVKLKLSPFANPIPDLVADPKAIESPFPTKPLALCIEILSPSMSPATSFKSVPITLTGAWKPPGSSTLKTAKPI